MNLHQICSPYISAVNPMSLVSIRISVGNVTGRGGIRAPSYATPGAFMGSINGTILTVRTVNSGVIQPGQMLADESDKRLAPNTMVTAPLPGSIGGPGQYIVSVAQIVPLEIMQTSLVLPAQLQPLSSRDLQQLEGQNLGGQKQAIYLNGDINGVVRIALKGGDLVELADGTTWLVNQQLEGFNMTSGWTKAALTLQPDS